MQRVVVLASLALGCGRVNIDPRTDAPAVDAPDAQILGRCAGSILLDDDFDVAGAAPLFVLNNSSFDIPATESGGELIFDLSGTISGRQYRLYRSAIMYPLADLCVTVEVTRIATCVPCGTYIKIYDIAQAAEVYAFADAANDKLAIRTHLNAVSGAGTIDYYLDVPFSLASTRFWQIRQVGNRTYWEVSGDGVQFARLGEQVDLFSDAMVTFSLGAGTPTTTSSGGMSSFARATAYGP